jgi:hypothetical protein
VFSLPLGTVTNEFDPLDSDGDGLSNAWEAAFGFNPNDSSDGSTDPDDDGLGNLSEMTAGTHPNKKDHPLLSLQVTTD